MLVYLRDLLWDLLRDLLRLRALPPDRLRERDFLRLADLRFLCAPPSAAGFELAAGIELAAGLNVLNASGLVSIFINQYVCVWYINIIFFNYLKLLLVF